MIGVKCGTLSMSNLYLTTQWVTFATIGDDIRTNHIALGFNTLTVTKQTVLRKCCHGIL